MSLSDHIKRAAQRAAAANSVDASVLVVGEAVPHTRTVVRVPMSPFTRRALESLLPVKEVLS